MKNARAKRAKILFVKYANLWSFCCHSRRGFSVSSLITTHDNDVDDFYGCNGIEPANSALLHIAIKTTWNSFETWLAILLAVLIIVLFKLQYLNFIAELNLVRYGSSANIYLISLLQFLHKGHSKFSPDPYLHWFALLYNLLGYVSDRLKP